MKRLLLRVTVCVGLVLAGNVQGQETNAAAKTTTEAVPLEKAATSRPDHYPISLGIEGGTTGFGGSAAWRFMPHLGIRGGMDYFSYSISDRDIQGISYNGRLRLQSEPAILDIYPWKTSSFRISVGALFNQNQVTGDSTGSVSIDGITYPNQQLSLKVTQNTVSPYLGIGGNLFYFDRAHHWSLGAELGAAYTGSPAVTLSNPTGGIPNSALESERLHVEDQIQNFKFWPVIKLAISYQF
jgi:hypothetical protein